MRFDIPTVGPVTIETCAECGVRQIALEAGKTILLERDRVEELCKRHKISYACPPDRGTGHPFPGKPARIKIPSSGNPDKGRSSRAREEEWETACFNRRRD